MRPSQKRSYKYILYSIIYIFYIVTTISVYFTVHFSFSGEKQKLCLCNLVLYIYTSNSEKSSLLYSIQYCRSVGSFYCNLCIVRSLSGAEVKVVGLVQSFLGAWPLARPSLTYQYTNFNVRVSWDFLPRFFMILTTSYLYSKVFSHMVSISQRFLFTHSQTPRCPWHCGVRFGSIVDTAESDFAVSLTTRSQILQGQWHCGDKCCVKFFYCKVNCLWFLKKINNFM